MGFWQKPFCFIPYLTFLAAKSDVAVVDAASNDVANMMLQLLA